TYMGFGIGLPHSRCDGVKKIMVSVVLLKNPLVYNDKGERVNLVVMIASPKEQGKEYLEVVADIMRILQSEDYRNLIMTQKTTEDLRKALEVFSQ
ncbi:MAG: PTS sugar transporter subunit IIA, partial [Fusobacteriaceae bacterium]